MRPLFCSSISIRRPIGPRLFLIQVLPHFFWRKGKIDWKAP
jgi:hypothetical protein